MKLQKTSLMTETACIAKRCESVADGRLSLPAGKSDIDHVLLVQGSVHVNAEPADGRVFMDGTVHFSVVFVDIEGNIDAFDSSSPFRHSEDMPGSVPGMNMFAKGSMREIEYTVEGGTTLSVRGIVSILLTGDVVTPAEAVSGTDAPDRLIPRRPLWTQGEQRTGKRAWKRTEERGGGGCSWRFCRPW